MRTGYTVRFGPARLRVEADARFETVLQVLAGWLTVDALSEGIDARITLVDRAHAVDVDRDTWSADGAAGWWDFKAWDAVIRQDVDGMFEYALHLHERLLLRMMHLLPAPVVRAAHVHGFARHEILASAALYGHLLPLAELVLVRHEATLVHASSLMGPTGYGVLILGQGGAGKTSASSQLYIRQPEQWRYMSDDLAIVTRDGRVHRSPVPLNIFPYNTKRFPELAAFVRNGAGVFDRMHWSLRQALFGAARVARRYPPIPQYLGAESASLRHVVELRRESVAAAEVVPVAADGIVDSARAVLDFELRSGLSAMRRVALRYPAETLPYPPIEELLDSAAASLREAIKDAKLLRVILPRRMPPDDVGAIVESLIAE